MAKQNLFRLSPRSNTFFSWIVKVSKKKTSVFIFGLIVGVICMSLYDKYQSELFQSKNQRIIDSLGVEISVKNRENDVLLKKADELDSLLKNQKNDVTNIINNFPSQQRPEIKRTDSAVKFIFNFMKN